MERRAHFRGRPRPERRVAVKFRPAGAPQSDSIVAHTHDIGVGGAYIATERPAPVGCRLEVEIEVPGPAGLIALSAEVRWVANADRMIAVIEEFGAYVVIAPGLALAHARPGPDVRREGLAVVTLAEAVPFGHPHNDPVRVVIGLAVSNAEDHVASVAQLANAFNDSGIVGRLAGATSADEVRGLLGVDAAPAGTGAGA